ncbi:energy transducer TonB [Thalassotalea nanhaiensis]|uniref:Protein TonB n=1 Tax=Thalassotalea nanhaiensis TaxID=3065648 RepID=A0ABY9TDG1_9GAMM|nr:energy transducer TonB [Colwelliaceae bacterium SQ345]
MKIIKCSLFSTLLLPAFSPYAYADTDLVQEIDFVSALPLKRVEPKYPIKEAKSGNDGWVQLSYVVEANGSVSNVIVENSSGSSSFEKSARRAVKKWKYEPALENGEPVESCLNRVQLDFKMHTAPSKKFNNAYKQASLLANEKTLTEFKVKIDELDKLTKNSNEVLFTEILKAQHAEFNNDKKSQLKHYENAIITGEHALKDSFKISLYQKLYSLYLHHNLFVKAYEFSDKIIDSNASEQIKEKYKSHRLEIDNLVTSDKHISIDANIENREHWGHSLVRNEFSITDIDGHLVKLEIRCANKRSAYTIEDNVSWKIPSSWQGCRVIVFGEDNTRFKLVELAKETKNDLVAIK